MTLGPKQLQVLRLLHAHRLMDTEQTKALAFEESTARACRRFDAGDAARASRQMTD